MKKKITIVDYGSGNVLSAKQSFLKVCRKKNITAEINISNKPEDIKKSSHVVLPGQGAFSTCMNNLKNTPLMIQELIDFALNKKKPFLGICVGMQMLATTSEENGIHRGLGWINGIIKKIPSQNLKMPHMGWNEVVPKKKLANKLFVKKNDYYFVHSYYFDCFDKDNVLAETQYGINFASIVQKENIYGVQFHPEKSSEQGLSFIESFIEL